MTRSRTVTAVTISIIISVLSVVEAGDACCKSEAAKRALIANPFVVKPANWDDEDDGPWEAPKVAMVDLPAWYRLLHETRLGMMGAAPLLISGVIAAALLTTIAKPLFPTSVMRSLLGSNAKDDTFTTRGNKNNNNAVVDSIRGSIFGLLVPFCSCGALPLAMALKQEGISSSSIAAFVTAAQAAGIDSLFFTYGVFGARVAILRLVAAGVLAFSVGMTLAIHDHDGKIEEDSKESEAIVDKGSCCGSDGSPGGGCQNEKPKASSRSVIASLTEFVNTAVELFSSVAVWVFLGVVVSACASIWLPPTSAAASAHTSSINPFLSADVDTVSVMKSIASRAGLFLLSLPMTICEHGIVSLADALRGIGFSAGTAVALIVTGPSTNAGTLLMLSRLNSTRNSSSSSSSSSSSNWVFDAMKIASVILIFGVTLSYLADDFGSSILMEKTETAQTTTSGDGLSLPGWLDQNAVSLAGLFTVASIVQSSSLLLLFRSTSLQSSSSSCST
jgi:uncharacterized membrane protein YraQ (UPF0718 family)